MLFSFLCLFERFAQTSENGCVNNEGSYEESVTKTQKKKMKEEFKSDWGFDAAILCLEKCYSLFCTCFQ